MEEPQRKKILVVDDDPAIGRTLSRLLAKQYEVLVLLSGVGMMAILDKFKPDVVILDVGLPWMNGYDICGMLRRQENYKKIPILFLSGYRDFVDVMIGMEAGANKYRMKPFEMTELQQDVAELIECGQKITS